MLRTYWEKFISRMKRISLIKDKTFFWGIIIAIAFIYNYNHILFSRPIGIHQWRNCVSASYALCYYYDGNFLEPKAGNFYADDFTSQVVMLECPVFYYFVSILYRIFGYHEFLFRLSNVLIGFFGLFSLFKMSQLLLKDKVTSIFVSLIIFTSTVYAFYLNNFITDATGLSFALLGLYQFYRYYHFKKFRFFLFSMFFAAIAGLLKAQSLMIYFSLAALFFFEIVLKIKFTKSGSKIFQKPWPVIAGFIGVIIVVCSWYLYAHNYTIEHHSISSNRFLRSAYWNWSKATTVSVWDQFVFRFKEGYFHSPKLIYFAALLFISNLIFIKKYNRLLNFFLLMVFVQGVLLFNIIFYLSIGRCDYYQINNLLFLAILFLNFFWFLKHNFPKIFNSNLFRFGVIILGILLVNVGRKGMKNKYSDWFYFNSGQRVEKGGAITPYLRNLGIQREDRVYYTPDPSMNISLYLMDQVGNTDFKLEGSRKQNIEKLKEKGLKYLMIADTEILTDSTLFEYTTPEKKMGEFNGVHIFRIE